MNTTCNRHGSGRKEEIRTILPTFELLRIREADLHSEVEQAIIFLPWRVLWNGYYAPAEYLFGGMEMSVYSKAPRDRIFPIYRIFIRASILMATILVWERSGPYDSAGLIRIWHADMRLYEFRLDTAMVSSRCGLTGEREPR